MIIVGMMVSSYKVELREKSLAKKTLPLRKKWVMKMKFNWMNLIQEKIVQ